MAVTQSANNNTEIKTVLSVDTGQSTQSIAGLKKEIKELRNELLNLDSTSQEYADTMVVLGNKTNQLREFTQEIARTNTDFGTSISNVTNVITGGVAAIQGMTAAMTLLGVEEADTEKVTQKLISSMALIQSLGKMESAVKSFKALYTIIKSNVAAAGGLRAALTGLTKAHPVLTALSLAATAVAAGIALIKKNSKEATDELKDQDWAVKNLTSSYWSLSKEIDNINNRRGWVNDPSTQKSIDEIISKFEEFRKSGSNAFTYVQAVWEKFYNKFYADGSEAEKTLVSIANAQYNYNKAVDEMQKIEQGAEGYRIDDEEQKTETLKNLREQINNIEKERNNLHAKYLNDLDKEANKAKQIQNEANKNAIEARKKRIEEAKKEADYNINLAKYEANEQIRWYEEIEKSILKNREKLFANRPPIVLETEKLKTTLKITQKTYEVTRKEIDQEIKIYEELKKTVGLTKEEILDYDLKIQNLKKSKAALIDEEEKYVKTTKEEIALLKLQTIESQTNVRNSVNAMMAYNKSTEILKQMTEEYKKINESLGNTLLKWFEGESAAQEFDNAIFQSEADIANYTEQIKSLNQQIEAYTQYGEEMDKISPGFTKSDEYLEKMAEFGEQMAELQNNLDEEELARDEAKYERKIALARAYYDGLGMLASKTSSLLMALADQEDISFEDSKKLKIASTIIDTLSGSVSAFVSGVKSGIPAPRNLILGGVLAAETVAQGLLAINKIRNTTKENASLSSGNTTSVQTVMTPPTIVNLNEMSDNIALPDQRVYVLESDITEAQTRVRVVETNNLI